MLPRWEAPDEYTHLWVITFLRNHAGLPSGKEVLAAGPTAVYGSLPPLGYLPHALVSRLFPDSSISFFARFGSLLAALLTVWAGWCIAKELFSASRLLALALPLMLVFHPQFVFVTSYANNDATACAIGSILIYLFIASLKYGMTYRRAAAVGFLLAWLSLCKYSGWTLFPVVLFVIGAATVLHSTSWKKAALALSMIACICLSITGCWLWRNYNQYSGDWLGTRTMYHTWAVAFHKQLSYHISPIQVLTDKRWWRFAFFSFWGMFGYTNRYIWRPLYYLFIAFHLLSAAGWLQAIRSRWLPASTRRWSRKELIGPAIWSMLLICCICNIAGMIYASTENLGGPQGRYLFVSEIPVLTLLLSGLSRIGAKKGAYAIGALLAFTAAVCIGSFVMLSYIYSFASHI